MADQVTTSARSMVERLFDPKVQDSVTKRGRDLMAALGEAAELASERAATSWREAEPIRRDAARAGREAMRRGSQAWRREVLPGLNRLWSKRAAALGAAGAAVPVARELIDDAAVRMGIRARREPRHWGAFLGGLLLGAAAGLVAAILTAPKAGREMRDELAGTAKDAATRAREVAATGAREVATRARDAAASAGEWVPIFQRPEPEAELNGATTAEPMADAIDSPAVSSPVAPRKRTPRSPAADGSVDEVVE
jgi:YtxH-like protein